MRKSTLLLLLLALTLLAGCATATNVCPEPIEIPESIILRLEKDGTAQEWDWLDRFDRQQQKLEAKP